MTDNDYLTAEAERLMEKLTPAQREEACAYIVELAKKQEEEKAKGKGKKTIRAYVMRFLHEAFRGLLVATTILMDVFVIAAVVATLYVWIASILYPVMVNGGILQSIGMYLVDICTSSGDCFFPRLYTAFMLAIAFLIIFTGSAIIFFIGPDWLKREFEEIGDDL